MGFFSARRSEDISEQLDQNPTVIRVIRSRFYGKQATSKTRNVVVDSDVPSSSTQHTSTADYEYTSQRPMDAYISSSSKSGLAPNTSSTQFQSTADSVTMTLAQRLDELAVANSEGLLNDDEYRLLRQSLFDRFASGSDLPSELSLVPIGVGGRNRDASGRTVPHNRRASSQYDASVKSPSVQSKRSLSSTVSGMIRRATSKRKSFQYIDDSRGDIASLFSSTSTSTAFPHMLSKQSSTVSLRTEYSLATEAFYSNRLQRTTDRGSGSKSVPASPSISRSITRNQRAAPPSSYSGKGTPREGRYVPSSKSDDFIDDDQLQTAHDIRQEIDLLEAEARRLLDAFNGLELSSLVRLQRHPGDYVPRSPALSSSAGDLDGRYRAGSVSMSPKGGSVRLARDHDATSIRSGQSIQTMFSASRAPSMHSKPLRSQTSVVAATLPRKNSVSSISVHSKKSGQASAPLSPSVSRIPSKLRLGSTSSVNLSRSANHLPLETVSEADPYQRPHSPTWSGNDSASAMRVDGDESQLGLPLADVSAEDEMMDIRRRRAEVTARYDARLEYLRARLRGAELREKLMRS